MTPRNSLRIDHIMSLPTLRVGNKATIVLNINKKTGNISTLPIFLNYENEEDFRIDMYKELKAIPQDKDLFEGTCITYQHDNYLEWVQVSNELASLFKDKEEKNSVEKTQEKPTVATYSTSIGCYNKDTRYERYLKNILYILGISFFLGVGIYLLVELITK